MSGLTFDLFTRSPKKPRLETTSQFRPPTKTVSIPIKLTKYSAESTSNAATRNDTGAVGFVSAAALVPPKPIRCNDDGTIILPFEDDPPSPIRRTCHAETRNRSNVENKILNVVDAGSFDDCFTYDMSDMLSDGPEEQRYENFEQTVPEHPVESGVIASTALAAKQYRTDPALPRFITPDLPFLHRTTSKYFATSESMTKSEPYSAPTHTVTVTKRPLVARNSGSVTSTSRSSLAAAIPQSQSISRDVIIGSHMALPISAHMPISPLRFTADDDIDTVVVNKNTVATHRRPIEYLDVKYRSLFKYPAFNAIQSTVFDSVVSSDNSLVVSAPTGSGKTAILELAIMRLLRSSPPDDMKIIYMAPLKAICAERCQDWSAKFSQFGLTCRELTGDTDYDVTLPAANLFCTTPEKWDSISRSWRDKIGLMRLVRLFMVDEVHVLNDPERGPTIEAIISRMKVIRTALEGGGIRFVAISATIPNATDIGRWLSSPGHSCRVFAFSDDLRPVPLKKVVIGYNENGSHFQFDNSLNYKLPALIQQFSESKPTLVFCTTRKSTQQAAAHLATNLRVDGEAARVLARRAAELRDGKLREVVTHGVAYHHAGVIAEDRQLIEELFINGQLPVLCSTSTLSMGVNLPAHLVVIKSTSQYICGTVQPYSDSAILQMLGRAGRPQFDTSATALILTTHRMRDRYQNMLSGSQLIESSFHKQLIEHLNAEVCLGTITSVPVALDWIQSTFLYIRLSRNPTHYELPQTVTSEDIDENLCDLVVRNIRRLAEGGMLSYTPDSAALRPLEVGRIMSRYCVAFETTLTFLALTGEETTVEVLRVIASCKEFSDTILRHNEKTTLNFLNKPKKGMIGIRFPYHYRLKTSAEKVDVLLQAQFGCMKIEDFTLQQDLIKLTRVGERVSRCLCDLLWTRPHAKALLAAVRLHKTFKAKLWDNSLHVARQLDGIGAQLGGLLMAANLTTFQRLERVSPRELEVIVGRQHPFGTNLHEAIQALPKYTISLEQSGGASVHLLITVTLTNAPDVVKVRRSRNHSVVFLLADADNHALNKTRIADSQLIRAPVTLSISVPRPVLSDELSVYLISDDIVGIDIERQFSLRFSGPPPAGRAAAIAAHQAALAEAAISKAPKKKAPKLNSQTAKIQVNDGGVRASNSIFSMATSEASTMPTVLQENFITKMSTITSSTVKNPSERRLTPSRPVQLHSSPEENFDLYTDLDDLEFLLNEDNSVPKTSDEHYRDHTNDAAATPDTGLVTSLQHSTSSKANFQPKYSGQLSYSVTGNSESVYSNSQAFAPIHVISILKTTSSTNTAKDYQADLSRINNTDVEVGTIVSCTVVVENPDLESNELDFAPRKAPIVAVLSEPGGSVYDTSNDQEVLDRHNLASIIFHSASNIRPQANMMVDIFDDLLS